MREIKQLLKITKRLKRKYRKHKKNFTISGNIIGDIGEVLAAEKYGLELHPGGTKVHDAKEISTGREIQIKSSLKGISYFPKNVIPDYFLSLNISEEGELEELFNGPGQFIVDHYINARNLSPSKDTYFTLAKGVLLDLKEEVPEGDKIKII